MIYIVEDDATIRELEQYALQTNGYNVRGLRTGLLLGCPAHRYAGPGHSGRYAAR